MPTLPGKYREIVLPGSFMYLGILAIARKFLLSADFNHVLSLFFNNDKATVPFLIWPLSPENRLALFFYEHGHFGYCQKVSSLSGF